MLELQKDATRDGPTSRKAEVWKWRSYSDVIEACVSVRNLHQLLPSALSYTSFTWPFVSLIAFR
jgi:hypothetical protein